MSDIHLETVAAELLRLDPNGARTAAVLRSTLDQLYDGQHTGRYRWDQLFKTEKTHFGTLVEINLHREFKFGDGVQMDYQIAGIEVDCKYSQSFGGWMIPPESLDHLCLLLWADDVQATWSMGLVRITEAILSQGGNRDGKRSITAHSRQSIRWLFKDAELPPNILLRLPRETVDRIMAMRDGQPRVTEIFRIAQGQRIGRGVVATLGQQEDYMKRVRGNGGSRSRLKKEGIVILGDFDRHRTFAEQLGLPVPAEGEFVSARVYPATTPGNGVARIDGGLWRLATDADPVVEAPDCPHK